MMRLLYVLSVIFLMCCISACAETLTIESNSDVVMCDSSEKLKAYLDGQEVTPAWSVSDERFMYVKKDGTANGINIKYSVVTLTVTAEYKGLTAEKQLTVVPAATRLKLTYNDENVGGGTLKLLSDSLQLKAYTEPEASIMAGIWTSSNEAVAAVDSNGLVTAIAAGSTEIRITLPNGKYASCKIKVCIPVETLAVVLPDEIATGESTECKLIVTPKEATDNDFIYTSSNPGVASVNDKGIIKANSNGTADITITSENGISTTCRVEVYTKVSGIKAADERGTLGVNNTYNLEFVVSPKNAKYTDLVYTSSDEAVLKVDENGVITGISEGKARVTASNIEGKSAYTDVTVKYIALTDAQIEGAFISLNQGDTKALEISLSPENASEKIVEYQSTNPEVAYADDGMIYAVACGRTTVSVWVNGVQTDSVNVRVISEDSLPLDGIKIGINPGHQIGLNLTQKPIAPGSDKTGNANSGYAIGVKTRTREYEVNLAVGLYLRDILEGLGAEVVMTRVTNDVNIDNIERAMMLNEAGVDFAIQLHCDNNKASNTIQGMSMFVKPKDYESYEIATIILKNATQHTNAPNRAVRWYSQYMSLNWSTTPTALIEMGYMSTEADDILLADPSYQLKIAEGIANGILEYYCGEDAKVY